MSLQISLQLLASSGETIKQGRILLISEPLIGFKSIFHTSNLFTMSILFYRIRFQPPEFPHLEQNLWLWHQ